MTHVGWSEYALNMHLCHSIQFTFEKHTWTFKIVLYKAIWFVKFQAGSLE